MARGALLRQLSIFGMVGVVATITHYVVALVAHEWLGVHLYVANIVGYVCAVGVSYVGHGRYTFQVAASIGGLGRFVLVSLTAFLASETLLIGLQTQLQLSPRWSLAAVVAIIPAISFVLNKFWVYRR